MKREPTQSRFPFRYTLLQLSSSSPRIHPRRFLWCVGIDLTVRDRTALCVAPLILLPFQHLQERAAEYLLCRRQIKQVQTRLGHGNIATTQRYLHAIKDADEETVNALQNLLITQHKASEDAKRKAE